MTLLNPRNAACQHVIVVDNDPAICDGLSMLIASEGMTCSIFADGISFLDQMPQEPPLFVLLDIDMPGMSGLDVLKELKSRQFHAPVFMISGHGDIPVAVEAIRNGALNFFEKPFAGESIIRRARDEIMQKNEGATKAEAPNLSLIPGGQDLTPRERDVLRAIASGASNKEAGRMLGISPRTVEVHRAKVMDKLGAKNAADLVRIVLSSAA